MTPCGDLNYTAAYLTYSVAGIIRAYSNSNMKKAILILVYSIILILNLDGRQWTNRNLQSFEGEFVESEGSNITIRRSTDGKKFTMPFKNLSDADQDYLLANKTSLCDLKPIIAKVEYAKLLVSDMLTYTALTVSVNNQECTEYLMAHAPSRLVYNIPLGMRWFTAYGVMPIGDKTIQGSWAYIVKADGKELYRSKQLSRAKGKQIKIEVKLPFGSKKIELITDSLTAPDFDQSVWAYPTFRKFLISTSP